MRDYTRKAKIKDSNEWVIGYHVYVDYLDKHYILVSEKTHDGFIGMLAMKQYEVDTDTICNPTGLTDKNGNKIWENDIVCINDAEKCVVRWRFGAFEFLYRVCANSIYAYAGTDLYINDNTLDIKVIGNTFDNEDLLKGE